MILHLIADLAEQLSSDAPVRTCRCFVDANRGFLKSAVGLADLLNAVRVLMGQLKSGIHILLNLRVALHQRLGVAILPSVIHELELIHLGLGRLLNEEHFWRVGSMNHSHHVLDVGATAALRLSILQALSALGGTVLLTDELGRALKSIINTASLISYRVLQRVFLDADLLFLTFQVSLLIFNCLLSVNPNLVFLQVELV